MLPAPAESDANQWVTARIGAAGFHVDLSARSYRLASDEPGPLGGSDTGPSPYELLLSALGSCTAMTLRMYADRRGYPVESIEVRLRQARAHERDCETCAVETVGVSHIERRISLVGALTDEMRAKLLEIADRCPVSQTITRGIPIETTM